MHLYIFFIAFFLIQEEYDFYNFRISHCNHCQIPMVLFFQLLNIHLHRAQFASQTWYSNEIADFNNKNTFFKKNQVFK